MKRCRKSLPRPKTANCLFTRTPRGNRLGLFISVIRRTRFLSVRLGLLASRHRSMCSAMNSHWSRSTPARRSSRRAASCWSSTFRRGKSLRHMNWEANRTHSKSAPMANMQPSPSKTSAMKILSSMARKVVCRNSLSILLAPRKNGQ